MRLRRLQFVKIKLQRLCLGMASVGFLGLIMLTSMGAVSAAQANNFTPQGSTTPIAISDGETVEIRVPTDIQPSSDSKSGEIQKVEYYLGGRLLATIVGVPYTYRLDVRTIRNGSYQFMTKVYFASGTTQSTQTVVVKNPLNRTQILLELRHYWWLLVVVVGAVLVLIWLVRRRRGASGNSSVSATQTPEVVMPPSQNQDV